MEKDTLVLGGQEFTSRFILGSGKYSLDLIKASVENAGAQIITLALRRANVGGTGKYTWITFRRVSPFFPILPVREMQTRQFVSQDFPAKSDAEIL